MSDRKKRLLKQHGSAYLKQACQMSLSESFAEKQNLHILLKSEFQAVLLLLRNGTNCWCSLWLHLLKLITKSQRKNFYVIFKVRNIRKNLLRRVKTNGGNLRISNRKWANTLNYNTDTFFNNETIIIIAVIIGLFLFLTLFINSYLPFKKERDYIKMEMHRSKGREYRYWKKRLRMLYVSKIPIVRSIVNGFKETHADR